jgi:hypothetical protein
MAVTIDRPMPPGIEADQSLATVPDSSLTTAAGFPLPTGPSRNTYR